MRSQDKGLSAQLKSTTSRVPGSIAMDFLTMRRSGRSLPGRGE
jgi:hypothetical protein